MNVNYDAIKKKSTNIIIPKEKRVKEQKNINRIGPGEYEIKPKEI